MANRHPFPRSLWGLDPDEAQRLLAELEEPLRRERVALDRAVELAEAEGGRLTAECAQLEEQIRLAEQRLGLIRQGLSRQRGLAPAQSLAVRRQVDGLEREHRLRLDQMRQREAALRAEIEQRRRAIHRWVMELLKMVAARGDQSGG